ncbi:MAG: choice-of-anchor Q domain-containing protein [Rhodanobacteraceae bacterium]
MITRLHRRPLALCLAAILAAQAAPAVASTITVTSCADAGSGSLRDAVAAAVSGDTIDFDANLGCSTITLTSGAITIGVETLEIDGPGRDALAIDGGYADRVLAHQAGAGGALTIAGLAMHHGFTGGDGGCLLAEGSVNLSDVELSECTAGVVTGVSAPLGNSARRGGALSVARDATLIGSFVGDSKVDGGAGYAYGAGLFAGGTATLIATTISGNFATSDTGATYGGGVAIGNRDARVQGVLTVSSTDIQNNAAVSHCGYCPVRGGGAFVYGNSTFEASTVSGNSSFSDAHYGAGGGLYFKSRYGGAPVTAALTDTDLGSNSSDDDGGAIGAAGDLSVTRGTISGNSGQSGGAIVQLSGALTLTDSLLTGNIALADGAGIFLFGYGDVNVVNSTISENIALGHGGALANSFGSVHFSNSTITGNSANEVGGGIWFDYAYYTLALESTIVAGNTVGGEADDIFAPGGTVEGSHDLIVAAPGLDVPGDTIGDDPLLLPLAHNGGPTMTHALSDASPAIDAGSNPLALPFDQRGDGFVRVYAGAADIGAFELQPGGLPDRIFADGFDP